MNILVVDDEMAALTKMKVLLTPYGECTLSTHGQQAFQKYVKAAQSGVPFGLVTIDIQLGELSGHDLLEQINQFEAKDGVTPARKLMISASGTRENLLKAHSKGCDGFLVKPVKRDDLEHKLLTMGFVKKG
ncbi:MAG: response regulator [Desulfatitalea sp.]|nr:response regulator [Desulfatitalea sp.]NNK00438.1 response regulator [Desulfatitalea sp.]